MQTNEIKKIPFEERKSVLRGLLDVACGCYPSFLLGGSLGRLLPVFHFHDVSTAYLRPYLQYLATNKYNTVTSDEIAGFVKKGKNLPTNSVALCFDDAWSSLYSVVYPLLKEFGMKAITYAIPGRVSDQETPFASWEQLREVQSSGLIDVQAHTYHHAMIFSDPVIGGFVSPDYQAPLLSCPMRANDTSFYAATDEGAPLYQQRSSMSDACRLLNTEEAYRACTEYVQAQPEDFFSTPDWSQQLYRIAAKYPGQMEAPEARDARILRELQQAREELNTQLKTDTVRHMCFPWAVAGKQAEQAVKTVGYDTAFADRLFGKRYVSRGDNPYRLMRLKHAYLHCLPGEGRKNMRAVRK